MNNVNHWRSLYFIFYDRSGLEIMSNINVSNQLCNNTMKVANNAFDETKVLMKFLEHSTTMYTNSVPMAINFGFFWQEDHDLMETCFYDASNS